MIQEKGNLGDVPPIRLFVTIFEEKETGILYLKRAELQKILYFNDGKFTWGFSNSPEDKLEQMLLSRKLITDHALDDLKKNPKFAAAPGKILVENGLITFEQLIELTREQLQQIFSSVLFWSEGGFQFVHDTPPNRLVLHQLEIPQFIFLGLPGNVDREMVEREIGPLQLELMKTTEAEKLKRYPLTPEQNQILESFGTGDRMDAVVSRFGPEGEKALRLIYFLYRLELLVEKETWHDDSPNLQHERIRAAAENDPLLKAMSALSPPPDEEPTVRMKSTAAPPFEKPLFLRENVARSNRLRFWMIAVFLVLAIFGLVGILTPPTTRKPESTTTVLAPEAISGRIPTSDGSEISIPKTEIGASPKSVPQVLTLEFPAGGSDAPPSVREQNEPGVKIAGDDPMGLFHSGNLAAAAAQWRQELRVTPGAYSVFLELDCLKESVVDAYNRILRKDAFFILPRKRAGQTCFLVLWGKFPTHAEASAAMKEIPSFFFQQQDAPQVVALRSYF